VNNLQLTLVLAVVSVVGIIGMLLFDGVPDLFAFLLAATPLYFGGLRFWKNRSISRRMR
jgi:hypothetical protein